MKRGKKSRATPPPKPRWKKLEEEAQAEIDQDKHLELIQHLRSLVRRGVSLSIGRCEEGWGIYDSNELVCLVAEKKQAQDLIVEANRKE